MSTEHLQACFLPSVDVYVVDVQRPGPLRPDSPVRLTPRTPGQTNTPALVLVVGALEGPAAQEQARRIAEREQTRTLRVAVCELEDGVAHTEARLSDLLTSFDAILTVTPERRQQLIDRLVRTLTLRDAQEPWIACDWDEVCRLAKASGGRLAHYGFGRGAGVERAATATTAAIAQVEINGVDLNLARGLCVGIQAPSKALYGTEIKEVVRQLQSRINRAATITLSIGCDSVLPVDALTVDIFAFGELSAAELMCGQSHADTSAASVLAPVPAAWEGPDQTLDPLYPDARALVLAQQRASISLVQRHLRIGYGRAMRLLDAMEGDILSVKGEDGSRVVVEVSGSRS